MLYQMEMLPHYMQRQVSNTYTSHKALVVSNVLLFR